jgi:rubrerythrin
MNPEVASEFHPTKNGEITPEEVGSGSHKRVWWLCKTCEHEWRTTPGHRTQRGSGCPACSNKALHIRGLNSLAATHPNLAAEFHPEKNEELTPSDIIAGTHSRLWWLCSTCDHDWVSTGKDRVFGNGCPACAPTGFQAGIPGYYYVHKIINIETQDILYYKGGISGDWKKRLRQLHRGLPSKMDIQNIETIWFEIGQSAMELESRLKAVHEIRAPRREFSGGDELFLVNPLDFARENGWV